MSRPSFVMSSDSRLIYARLKQVAAGETISNKVIADSVSQPIEKIRGAIATARRHLMNEDRIVFSSVYGVGLMRCRDEDLVDESVKDTVSIRRKARTSVKKLSQVNDFAAMAPAKQLEHTTRISILGAIADMTRENSVEKVRKIASGRSSELPIADTLAAFR